MSFILDALKKSESDRQRQSGPALFEVKVAPPRTVLPLWGIALAVLFAVNLGIVVWILMRHPAPPGAQNPPEPAHTGAGSAPLANLTQPVTAPPAAVTPVGVAPGAVTPVGVAPGAVAPAAVTPAAIAPMAAAPAAATPAAAAPATVEARTHAQSAAPTSGAMPNPDDYAPAAEPSPNASLGHVKRGTEAGVPLYQQAATTPGIQLPQLRLDLHAYAEKPGDRWVMINMHKLREGDSLPEGVHVDRITPDGAVLSYQGSQFLLTRD